jgi:transcriptional regulator with XRE-family HTH domain
MIQPESAARKGAPWKVVRRDAMSHIKQAIRDELEATGMTQADLARFIGASEKHVSQVLTGKVHGTFDFLAKMAAACGFTLTVSRAGRK